MKKVLLFLFVGVAIFNFVPVDVVSAQEGLSQLSQCSGTDCSACNAVHLANGIIKWLIGILFVIFAILVAVAGVKLVVSGGNHHALDEAKGMFLNAIIGFIIILSAWLIVDTIMRTLVGTANKPGQLAMGGTASGYLFWSQVQCQRVYTPNGDAGQVTLNYEIEKYENGQTISESGITGPSANPPISTTPAVITGNLVTYAGAQFDSGIVSKVQYVATTFGLRVSGGYRTAARNREVGGVPNSNHLTGRAADFVGTQAKMEAARQWARNNGAREALIHNAGSGTHLHLAW